MIKVNIHYSALSLRSHAFLQTHGAQGGVFPKSVLLNCDGWDCVDYVEKSYFKKFQTVLS